MIQELADLLKEADAGRVTDWLLAACSEPVAEIPPPLALHGNGAVYLAKAITAVLMRTEIDVMVLPWSVLDGERVPDVWPDIAVGLVSGELVDEDVVRQIAHRAPLLLAGDAAPLLPGGDVIVCHLPLGRVEDLELAEAMGWPA